MSMVSSLCILVINSILTIVITLFAEIEIHSNITDYETSLAKKLGIA